MRSRLSETGRSLRTTGQPQTFCSRPIPSDARPGCEECIKQLNAGCGEALSRQKNKNKEPLEFARMLERVGLAARSAFAGAAA